ncbi:Dna-binding protein [Methylorubrum populi]|uniref:Dna-binding protein n=1 Tax=Methylorubrum populi TaxID=223967 RepID=A0A160PHC7_9HYPH|nr:type II toxin-antitoxin system HicB family antitoxin [Methylorubrum populi]BAU92244.1 Dna-binding protein [Methylorubrum populi]
MTAYIGILEKEPETLWGVWFPDLPGCIAAGETADETVAQASEALGQWLTLAHEDGRAPSRPRTIEELRSDADFAEAMASEHLAMLVRPPIDELDLDERRMHVIDTTAEQRGLSRRSLVRELVLKQIAS